MDKLDHIVKLIKVIKRTEDRIIELNIDEMMEFQEKNALLDSLRWVLRGSKAAYFEVTCEYFLEDESHAAHTN